VSFDSNICSTLEKYKVGDQVELYYDPQNPQAAQIKSFAAQYLASTSLAIVGLPIAIVGLFALFLQKKRRRASQGASG
jgi:LPXTG-motif cell wall-anchored protein